MGNESALGTVLLGPFAVAIKRNGVWLFLSRLSESDFELENNAIYICIN
jgi:hypothetical protein